MFRPQIQSLAGYVPGEQPQGGKFIKLNTNENPYPASPAVAAAIDETLRRGLGRYPDPLASSFRLAAESVLGVDPEGILCGNGSDDLLTILTRSCVDAGQRIRFPYPSYVLYHTLAQLQGAESQEIAFRDDWTLGPEFTAPDPESRLNFLPNPNSPTGTLLSPEQVSELAAALPCPLVVDEAYAEFADRDCLSLIDRHPNVVITRTMSKSYGLAGLRFGYLAARPEFVHQLRKVKDSYNCDALSIAGATAALLDQEWLRKTRAAIVATRARMTEALRGLGFAALDSQANFVWCEHPQRPAETLYRELKRQGILVRHMNYARWREGLRISVGTDEQIDALLHLLRAMV